jgi:hypothetical protein
MDDTHVIKLLRAAVAKAARQHDLRQKYVSMVLTGSRRAGPQILAALGLERTPGAVRRIVSRTAAPKRRSRAQPARFNPSLAVSA